MLINKYLKYFLSISFFALTLVCNAQAPIQEEEQQSVITIVGNSGNNNYQEIPQQYINTVNYQSENTPPEKGVLSNQEPQYIEPTLENGFHMRFTVEAESPKPSNDRLGSSGYTSTAGSGLTKTRKSGSASKHKFNLKKKLKCWFPKRKKKYRPNLCVDF